MSSVHVEFYKGKIFTVLFAVFLGGVAAGGIGMKVYHDHVLHDSMLGVDVGTEETYETVQHLAEELDLSEQQFSDIKAVLDECIMNEAEMMNQIQMLRTALRERITKILNSEQRDRFEVLLHQASVPTPIP